MESLKTGNRIARSRAIIGVQAILVAAFGFAIAAGCTALVQPGVGGGSGGNGVPACSVGLTRCTGTCANTTNDPAHCGGCGMPCTAGQVCDNGTCAGTCSVGSMLCGSSCSNVGSDPAHCGNCTTACRPDQICGAGSCGCPAGQSLCNGVCAVACGGSGGSSGIGTGGTGVIIGTGGAGPGVVLVPPTSPGTVVARRLNQLEYNNTVRDLLGTTLKPAIDFPADDLGDEFDTVGSALSLSPTYVAAYEKAAYAVVDDLLATTDAARRARVVTCNVDTAGDTCAKTILTAFARKAWRRPVTADEATGLMLPVTTAKTLAAKPTDGLRYGLAGVLMSPFFFFKLEIDPDPASVQPRRLGPHEIATRLSYALWSTTPDDMLSAAADGGRLATDAEITAQIERMLVDARSDTLLDSFAAEWLDFKTLETHEVVASKFPTYKPALALSMKAEARRFIREFLRSEMPVAQVLNGRFVFVDATLATHYGLTRTGSTVATDFVRVDTTAAPRAGILTLGAFLMTTSLSSRTSPVKRGQFVYERLLCGTVPAPPPDIPALPENMPGLTGRQLAEAHRVNPTCAACHTLMDPIGFGLENYDAIGTYRTMEGTSSIDASGALPNGSTFNGAVELANNLAKDPRFTSCVTKKFMTFAVGRLLNQKDDASWVSYLAGRAEQSGAASLPSIIRAILLSDGFRSRQPAAM